MSGKGAFFTPGNKPLFPFFRKKEESAPRVPGSEGIDADSPTAPNPSEPLAQGSPMDWSKPNPLLQPEQTEDGDSGLPPRWGPRNQAAQPIAAEGSASGLLEDVPMAWTPPANQGSAVWPEARQPEEQPMTPPSVKADPLPQDAALMEFSPADFSGDPAPWTAQAEVVGDDAKGFLHVEEGLTSVHSEFHPHFEVVTGGALDSVAAPPPMPPIIEESPEPLIASGSESDWMARVASEWEPGPLRPVEEEGPEEPDHQEDQPPSSTESFTWDSVLNEAHSQGPVRREHEPFAAHSQTDQSAEGGFNPPAQAWGAPAWGWPTYAKDESLDPTQSQIVDGTSSRIQEEAAEAAALGQLKPAPSWGDSASPEAEPMNRLDDEGLAGSALASPSMEPTPWTEPIPQAWPEVSAPPVQVPPPLPPQADLTVEPPIAFISQGFVPMPPPLPRAAGDSESEAAGFQWPEMGADAPSEEEVLAHVWRREEEPDDFGDAPLVANDLSQIQDAPPKSMPGLASDSGPLSAAEAPLLAFDQGEAFASSSTFSQWPAEVKEEDAPEVIQPRPLSDHEAALLAFDQGEVITPSPSFSQWPAEAKVEDAPESFQPRPLSDHEAALLAFDQGEAIPQPLTLSAKPAVLGEESPVVSQAPGLLVDPEAALAAFDRGEVISPLQPKVESAVERLGDEASPADHAHGSAGSWSDSPDWMKSAQKLEPAQVSEMIWVDEAPAKREGDAAKPVNQVAAFEEQFEKSIERLFSLNRDFRWKKVGELLQELGLVSDADLAEALSLQAVSKKPLGRILVEQGIISDRLLLKVLAAQKDVVPCFLDAPLEPDLLSLLEPEFCLRCQVLPVSQKANVLTLAMRNPSDVDTIDFVAQATGLAVEPGLADEELLAKKIEEAYARDARSHRAHVDALVQEAIKTSDIKIVSIDESKSVQAIEEETRPVSAIVQKLLSEGVKMRASDIHMEPTLRDLQIRYRIDGRLHKVNSVPKELQPMILARVKILAELDPVEWRIPQDGRISFECEGKVIDLRVSVLPSFYGGRVVMRILDRSIGLKNLEDIGFSDSNLGIFRTLIKRPYGLFLVTGPTGSGKTTSLYAALNEVKDDETNIITCEDPVEYNLEGISQSQVNSKIGLTFAAQLRSILRQDPDVVLVGEIRDHETAETAIRASMTGHLVFSTLHCNDAPSAIPRLLDMNIDPYLLSTSLIGVMGQRLLRRICPECMHDYSPSEEERTILERTFGLNGVEKLYKGRGCVRCAHTGFKGRFAVHEIMPVTHEISSFIAERSATEKLAEISRFYGYRTMQEDAMERVLRGQTSLKEAQRLLAFDDIPKMDPAAGRLQG